MTIRKDQIAAAFAQAASHYDSAAGLQRLVARRLADLVLDDPPLSPAVLEVGCGTGYLSSLLIDHIRNSRWTLTDIAPSMLDQARGLIGSRARYHVMDGEHPDLPEESFDLIVSSLAMQWFQDLEGGIEALTRLLAPGGMLVFATLGNETFREWRAVHRKLGLSCGVPSYPACLPCRTLAEERIKVPYADGQAFLRSLKAIGAHVPAPGHKPLPPGDLRRAMRALGKDCSITYHILYGIVRKDWEE